MSRRGVWTPNSMTVRCKFGDLYVQVPLAVTGDRDTNTSLGSAFPAIDLPHIGIYYNFQTTWR